MADEKEYLLNCVACDAVFFTEGEKYFYAKKGLNIPGKCKSCRDQKKVQFQERKIQNHLLALPFKQTKMTELVSINASTALYIIGNGFDLMHNVPSRYTDFRNTLSKNSSIRFTLETYIRKEDIWGDFEDSLAHLDRGMMLGSIDDRLDDLGVLEQDDDDFSAADFFIAQEITTIPVDVLTQELPKRFRRWINSLQPQKQSNPLVDILMLCARYINFNYTEMLETNYAVPKQNILYIHGDRRDKKKQLVLGHGRDYDEIFEEWYQSNKNNNEFQTSLRGRKGRFYNNDNPVYLAYFLRDETKGNWRNQTRCDAIHNTVGMIENYYDDSAKKTNDILTENNSYFKSLQDLEKVVVIGHSLSDVDYPYFKKIIKYNHNGTELKWFFSWYNIEDLERIKIFVSAMNIPNSNVQILRT